MGIFGRKKKEEEVVQQAQPTATEYVTRAEFMSNVEKTKANYAELSAKLAEQAKKLREATAGLDAKTQYLYNEMLKNQKQGYGNVNPSYSNFEPNTVSKSR